MARIRCRAAPDQPLAVALHRGGERPVQDHVHVAALVALGRAGRESDAKLFLALSRSIDESSSIREAAAVGMAWCFTLNGLSFFFVVIGMNSILIYLAGRFVDFAYTTDFFFAGLLSPLPDAVALPLWWVGFVFIEWGVLYFLYTKKTFLRV